MTDNIYDLLCTTQTSLLWCMSVPSRRGFFAWTVQHQESWHSHRQNATSCLNVNSRLRGHRKADTLRWMLSMLFPVFASLGTWW